MPPDPPTPLPFLGHLDQWMRSHRGELSAHGDVVYRRWLDRPKASAHLLVRLDDLRDVELLVWTSGEAEFNRGPVGDDVLEHLDLTSEAELGLLLDRFTEALRAEER